MTKRSSNPDKIILNKKEKLLLANIDLLNDIYYLFCLILINLQYVFLRGNYHLLTCSQLIKNMITSANPLKEVLALGHIRYFI